MEGETQCNTLGSFALPMPIQQPCMFHSNQLALLIRLLIVGTVLAVALLNSLCTLVLRGLGAHEVAPAGGMGNLSGQRRRAV